MLNIFDDVGAFLPHEIYRASQHTINRAFKKAMLNKTMWADWRPYFDSNVTIENPRVTFMKSSFSTGGPIEIKNANGTSTRFENTRDRPEEQEEIVMKFVKRI